MSKEMGKVKFPLPFRLRTARNKMGISQKELGVKAGMDEFSASARINQYEQGKHTPDYQTTKRLADVLGVPVPYLYAETDELAELILVISNLPKKEFNKLLQRYC